MATHERISTLGHAVNARAKACRVGGSMHIVVCEPISELREKEEGREEHDRFNEAPGDVQDTLET